MQKIDTERRKEEIWGAGKKWTAEGVFRFYTAGLPTELPTKNRIIFFWVIALNSVNNVHQYSFEICTKILKIPLDFSIFVGNCASEHTRIGFAASVGKFIGKCAGSLTVMHVGMCAIR